MNTPTDIDKLKLITGPESTGLYLGDAKKLSDQIPSNIAVDLVMTDPVYDRVEDFVWLSETANRVLKMDRPCLVWCSIERLGESILTLSSFLHYRWCFASMLAPGKKGQIAQDRMFSNWRALLWLERGKSRPSHFFGDVKGETDNTYDGLKGWGKSLVTTQYWLSAFSQPDDLVFDPFAGGGTTLVAAKRLQRRWLGFEMDVDTYELAQNRLKNTPVPIPDLMPVQMHLED